MDPSEVDRREFLRGAAGLALATGAGVPAGAAAVQASWRGARVGRSVARVPTRLMDAMQGPVIPRAHVAAGRCPGRAPARNPTSSPGLCRAHARAVLVRAVEARAGQPGSGAVLMDSYGGAINRVPRHPSAFVHRDDIYAVQYLTYGGGAAWLASTHAQMRPFVSGFAYQNYIDPDLASWRHDYYGSNYGRLVHVQQRVDPHHQFHFPQAIGR